MKIVFLSDTHRLHSKVTVPDGDMLVHCGDWTNKGETFAIDEFLEWFSGHPHPHKIFICGNHEVGLGPVNLMRQNKFIIIQKWLDKDSSLHYLEESDITIEGVKFYGSPWSPFFFDWEFNAHRGADIAAHWAKIPDDVQVLITHGPPYGILDLVSSFSGRDPHQGCEELLSKIGQLKQLKLHCFGHLHLEGGNTKTVNGVTFVNAAICNDNYQPLNPVMVVEI